MGKSKITQLLDQLVERRNKDNEILNYDHEVKNKVEELVELHAENIEKAKNKPKRVRKPKDPLTEKVALVKRVHVVFTVNDDKLKTVQSVFTDKETAEECCKKMIHDHHTSSDKCFVESFNVSS